MNATSPGRRKLSPAASPVEPAFSVPVIKMRQPDGSLLVKAGRPEMVADEVSVSTFHKETGVSKRHIATLCEQGLIQHRRLTPKKDSKIMIPRSEIERFHHLDGEASDIAQMRVGDLGGPKVATNGSGAPNSVRRASRPLLRSGLIPKKSRPAR
jgi:hypothetical protein